MNRTTLVTRTSAVWLVLGAVVGCSNPRLGLVGIAPPERVAGVAAAPAASDLMTAADVAALTKVATLRAGAPGAQEEGYRIGPDDLLEIRIPDLIDAQAPAGARLSAASVGAGQVVAGAPAFQQGMRVSGGGRFRFRPSGRCVRRD